PGATVEYIVNVQDGTGNIIHQAGSIGMPVPSDLIEVFPNPVTDLLHLNVREAGEWTLFDAAGRTMQTATITSRLAASPIATDELSDGTYFLQFRSASGMSKTITIIVDH